MFTQNWKDGFIATYADVHITTTEHLRKQIVRELGANQDDVYTVYGGINEQHYVNGTPKTSLRETLGLPQSKTLIGYIGFFRTLGLEKGIDIMINSLKFLENENATMVFVGGLANEIEYYKILAENTGVIDRCVFIGRIPFEKVSEYERAMDILVIPYPDTPHFRKYGFPMKTYEYMASGTPIIYSNLPIIDEVMREYGFSFSAGDSQSLSDTVRHVLTDRTAGRELAQKAKARAHN
ncbi:MAG: glycosyltransferase family 4 protein, partial [Patescibacteria group bacterium]